MKPGRWRRDNIEQQKEKGKSSLTPKKVTQTWCCSSSCTSACKEEKNKQYFFWGGGEIFFTQHLSDWREGGAMKLFSARRVDGVSGVQFQEEDSPPQFSCKAQWSRSELWGSTVLQERDTQKERLILGLGYVGGRWWEQGRGDSLRWL